MSQGRAPSTEGTGRQALPEGRYGTTRTRSRAPRRWQVTLIVVLALVGGGAAVYFGYTNLVDTPIEAQRVGYEERPGNAMEITIDVTRQDPERPGVCIVRVRDISGAESGRKEILVAPGESRVSTVIRSIRRPVTADVYGCSYDIPEYLSRA
ncbi:DUF4307 domain-containing protein [Prauserella oleivorans]|uniref:DUF4307 domain-containing protein n=1 Tax=Prauserella oleivorans TaxID=1478153 RepID=A0ABW5W4L0_9PSEU